MFLGKYIIIGILNAIVNILPIAYSLHIFIYQNTFNTKIFNDTNLTSLVNIATLIAIIIINYKLIFKFIVNFIKTSTKKKKEIHKKYKKYLKIITISTLLSTIIYLLIPHNITNLKSLAYFYIITAILILFSTNKKGTKSFKELTYKDSILFSLSSFLTLIPTISPLCSNLFISSKLRLNKETSLTLSFLTILPILCINSLNGVRNYIIDTSHILENSIALFLSIFLSIPIYNYLKKLYTKNKLYILSIYCLLLSLFILIWFR